MVQTKRLRRELAPEQEARTGHLEDLLTFYYPMHYRIGMDLETVMGQGRVSRKQAAILWLIHSRADDEGWVRRKVIETRLSTWFEVSNSSISNLLRELTRAPLELVQQVENPSSGREKLVRLTPQGRIFVDGMIAQSVEYLRHHLGNLGDEQLAWGIQFFKLAFRPLGPDEPGEAIGPLDVPPTATTRG
jgi:DNA-binding PadR family transcriptional regulator